MQLSVPQLPLVGGSAKDRLSDNLTDLFLEHLPHRPNVAQEKDGFPRIRGKKWVSDYSYVQPNQPYSLTWLVFDIDCPKGVEWFDGALTWLHAGLPAPNFAVSCPDKGSAHLFYGLINPVCTSANGRLKPQEFLEGVYAQMAETLEADPGFNGLYCRRVKNPLHKRWQATVFREDLYELNYLYEAAGSIVPSYEERNKIAIEGTDTSQRNETVFLELRYWAYSQKRTRNWLSYESFHEHIETKAHAINLQRYGDADPTNEEAGGLYFKEVHQIARSVSKWVWNRYTGSGDVARGVMDLETSDLSLKEKQAMAAKYAGQQRKAKTLTDMAYAYKRAVAQVGKPTQAYVAMLSGISLRTIKTHWHWLLQEWRPVKKRRARRVAKQMKMETANLENVSLDVGSDGGQKVQFGVSQVTPPVGSSDNLQSYLTLSELERSYIGGMETAEELFVDEGIFQLIKESALLKMRLADKPPTSTDATRIVQLSRLLTFEGN
ncbi:replication initiation protein [Terasakiella pusilla]|uniref:replication initiation protein n=1 Tax=Terasakiella pusilla TaxID=64973 RepID=UPI003AA969F0